jgi:SpoVK/Ycf46/Vps4 family AAA+-type ATPase
MGILFTGPMGTGKTFVAEAFVKETGLTAIKLKNFRSKWVGATEGNLEKILSVVQALGPLIVIVDEGDRAFGNQEGDGDGGTSSRVMARLKEFMSDTSNRGRVLFLIMTNRPDKLDIDIKRAGRLDRKIPFLYPQEPSEVEAVLKAQIKKHNVVTSVEFPRDNEALSAHLIGYSNADIEAVVLLANDYARDATVTLSHFIDAKRDYLPSRDSEMLEYMELVAVFEASNRRMLPKKYADLPVEELEHKLAQLRARVGARR